MDLIEFIEYLLQNSIIYILGVISIITLALTVRTLTMKKKDKIHPPSNEESPEQEVRPLPDEGALEEALPLPDEGEITQEIRPLLDEVTSESCEYCAIFKDLGTMVCPNCGRPLNIRLPEQEKS